MTAMGVVIRRFGRDERGATAMEYGLIAGLIAIGMLVAFTVFGGALTGIFQMIADRSKNAMEG